MSLPIMHYTKSDGNERFAVDLKAIGYVLGNKETYFSRGMCYGWWSDSIPEAKGKFERHCSKLIVNEHGFYKLDLFMTWVDVKEVTFSKTGGVDINDLI